MINEKYGRLLLLLVTVISIGTAIAHVSCIFLGPQCYSVQMAPPEIIQSAKEGTILAPLGTAFISLLFMIVALFSLSSAKLIRPLPLLSFGVYGISFLCIARGIATIPLSFIFPEIISLFSIIAGIVWFFSGLMLFVGHKLMSKNL